MGTKGKGKSKSKGEGQVKKDAEKTREEPKKSPFREVFEILMYGLSLLIFLKGFVWQNFQIPTSSMENTLLVGDHITANTFIFKNAAPWERKILPFRDVKRGDIVVFKFPGNPSQDYIKRCIGVPGDTFELDQDEVKINGEVLREPYPYYKEPKGRKSDRDPENRYLPYGYDTMKPGLENADPGNRNNVTVKLSVLKRKTHALLKSKYQPLDPETYRRIEARLLAAEAAGNPNQIPEGFYVMMGDNRNRSNDSRSWGLVPREFVMGKAYFVWWSYGEDENSHELKGWPLIKSYLRVPFTFWTRTHWDQTFALIK